MPKGGVHQRCISKIPRHFWHFRHFRRFWVASDVDFSFRRLLAVLTESGGLWSALAESGGTSECPFRSVQEAHEKVANKYKAGWRHHTGALCNEFVRVWVNKMIYIERFEEIEGVGVVQRMIQTRAIEYWKEMRSAND